jgi:hypothetical protein
MTMKKRLITNLILMFFLTTVSFAGFKSKIIKSKPSEKFQISFTASGVTFAADLLLSDKEQKEYFSEALNQNNLIPVRLAVFNNSKDEVLIPLDGIQLICPGGKALKPLTLDAVVKHISRDSEASSKDGAPPVQVSTGPKIKKDSRTDRTSPNYDPRLDPTDPRYDPNDPRNTGRNRTYDDGRMTPGVDVVLNPSRGGGNTDEITRRLIEKDLVDKAFIAEPIAPSFTRDRFLYFSIKDHPTGINGFELHLPQGNGVSQDVILIF